MSEANVIIQEFYCNDCQNGGAYFRVRLHAGFNRRVVVVCPRCKRQHPRTIRDGVICEDSKFDPEKRDHDEIHVPLSAWSNEPMAVAMAEARDILRAKNKAARNPLRNLLGAAAAAPRMDLLTAYRTVRNGVVIADNRDIIEESWADRYMEPEQEPQ